LYLFQGSITAAQLFHITSSSHSSLRTVEFTHLTGVSNEDFQHFLSDISSTLNQFIVSNSTFSRKEGEEYALDTVMPNMTNLCMLDIEGDVVSALAIERKGDITASSESARGSANGIRVRLAPAVDVPGIVRALESTSWAVVTVKLSVGRQDQPLLIKARSISEQRGIKFQCT
jgi:hypothetical protein